MTSSPSSGLSAEAKEFVPVIQISSTTNIPLYLDENAMASIYPSSQQHQPLMYPITKFPEIEFHIQPSQQIHIDSRSNIPQSSSRNGNTSQIVLLPTTTPSHGYYPGTQILYSSNEQPSTFYPINYCEQPLINFPKTNRTLPPPPQQQQRHDHPSPSIFRPQRGMHNSSYRGVNHRNFYYDQQDHRNFNSSNSKPISSSRSRGIHSRESHQQHDEQKQGNFNYQNNENDYQQSSHINDDGTPFEFRSEDFPSLPINQQKSDKTPPPSVMATYTKPTSSWNAVVSAPRPHSTSPHSAPSSSSNQSQSQRSQRSPSSNKNVSSTNEKKLSNNKKSPTQTKSKSPSNASKINSSSEQQHSQSLTSSNGVLNENNTKDDGFIQTKQQQKRSRQRKNKTKEEPKPLPEQSPTIESTPFALDDENAFPTLGQQISIPINKKSENDSSTKDNVSTPGLINTADLKANHSYQIRLTDMFNALSTSTQTKQQNSHAKTSKTAAINSANPLDSNPVPKRGKEREQPKSRKPTKLKRIINKELEENQKQRQQLITKATTIKQTDEQDIQDENNLNIATTTEDFLNDPSMNVLHVNMNEYTSASCTEESNNETEDDDDDDDDDEILDHEPTSQLQTPFSHQIPQSNIKQQIHDSGFREYCSQLIDRQLDELCIQLLITLKRFQDRKKQQFQSNPERARRKRRFVHGIREVTKHLRLQRLKCVLIAPDCQSIQSQGGLNDVIEQIINLCKEQNIPYIFTLNRQKLGRCLNKISRISAIGIFDYSGADQIYKQIIDITNENQRAYTQITDNTANHDDITTPSHGLNSRDFFKILHRTFQQQQQQQQPRHHIVNTIPNESLSKILPKVPAHYAHSRQTSDTSTIYIDPQLINSMKQHTRASSGTFDMSKVKKNHQRTLSDGAAAIDDTSVHMKHHSRTPSGCSAISQIDQQDYFEQSKNILMINNTDETFIDNEENRLKSIHEDTEESSANIKRKNVEKWINDN